MSSLLPSGEINKLKDEIGVKKMVRTGSTLATRNDLHNVLPLTQEMLLDLLVHSEGLRLRDRISHGEVGQDHVIVM